LLRLALLSGLSPDLAQGSGGLDYVL
jgi:hypothetical protein